MNCVAFDNLGKGFDQNHNTAGVTVFNCTGIGNQNKNFSFPEIPTTGVDSLINNLSFRGGGSNSLESNSVQVTNSWNGFTVSDSDFISLDTSLAKTNRNADSSLRATDLFRLSKNSQMIDAGTDVGILFKGTAPDIGAFESDFVSSVSTKETQIINYRLEQNFPNPFNPTTKIKYSVPSFETSHELPVQLKIYDILGNLVITLVNGYKLAGNYEVEFNSQS